MFFLQANNIFRIINFSVKYLFLQEMKYLKFHKILKTFSFIIIKNTII